MAVSSIKDFWIHPNALTITLNYFGDPQLIQTSMLAGAVIMAYRKDVISYDAAHNFREWKLQAFPTQLNDTCAYYVHAELSRSGDTAMIIYSPVKRDIQGRTLLRVEKDEDGRDVEVWDNNLSTESYFIYLGTISASVDNEGATVERAWTDGFYTGTLDTDQQRMEEASGEWKTMFNYNAVTDQIEPLKPFSKIKVMGEAIFQSIAQFVNGLVIGKRKITDVAASSDSGNVSKVSDATLPTTGYVQKEIEALDDHFLIKDNADTEQFVAGTVTFEKDVIVQGDHAVEGVQTIGKEDAAGNFDVNKVVQEVKGKQILHGGFQTPNFNNAAGQITGAHLTPDGKLYVAGLKANNFEIDELVFNVVKAQGGEFVYSTSAIISSCTYVMKTGSARLTPDDFYALSSHNWADIDHVEITLKEDELTRSGNPFVVGDIIYGKVNKVSDSGKYAVGGQCIMHITEIGDGLNITAKLYQVGEYGLTDNIPPIEDMTIAHRGNEITHDGNGNEINQDRRTSFYLSTIDGNLVMLHNVTTPTLSAANYGASLGKLPYDLLIEVQKVFAQINENSSVVYADYGIFKNFIQFDLQNQPIQRENNRGEWDANTEYYNEKSYYDVVTYRGALYKCTETNKGERPSESDKWLLLVSGGAATIYTLEASPSAVHLSSKGILNARSLDVWVNANSESYTKIDDQEVLNDLAMSVWYSIDNSTTRSRLIVGGSRAVEIEEGGSLMIAEDGDSDIIFITLEGESIDISSIQEKIYLHLVKNADATGYGEDVNSMYIPVVRDGSTTKNNILLNSVFDEDEISTKTSSVSHVNEWYPWNNNTKWEVVPNTFEGSNGIKVWGESLSYDGVFDRTGTYVFSAVVKGTPTSIVKFNVDIACNSSYSPISGNVEFKLGSINAIHSITPLSVGEFEQISIRLIIREVGSYRISLIGGATEGDACIVCQPKLEFGSEVTPYIPATSDLVGPAGKAGPVGYPQGEWKSDVTYTKTDLTAPFVWYRNDNRYYLLKADKAEGNSQSPSNEDYWQAFTQFEYLFVKMLMANWAMFGGERGGVFLDRYLFSQDGIANGKSAKFGDYQQGNNAMFNNEGTDEDPKYRLNGKFVPNLFLDFLGGAIKSGKMSETFYEFEYLNNDVKTYVSIKNNYTGSVGSEYNLPLVMAATSLDENIGYNISIVPHAVNDGELNITNDSNWKFTANEYRGGGCYMVCMPLVDNIERNGKVFATKSPYEPDGMRSTILVREDTLWNNVKNYVKKGWDIEHNLWKAHLTSGAILCADARIVNQMSYIVNDATIMYYPKYYTNGEDGTVPKKYDSAFGGFFVVSGHLTKFLLVEPGGMVRLRSCTNYIEKTGVKYPLWYVENSDDFEQLDVDIRFNINHVWNNNSSSVKKVSELNIYDYETEETVETYPFKIGYEWFPNDYDQTTGDVNLVFASKGICEFDAYKILKSESFGYNEEKRRIYINTDDYMFFGDGKDPMCNIKAIAQIDYL